MQDKEQQMLTIVQIANLVIIVLKDLAFNTLVLKDIIVRAQMRILFHSLVVT